MKDANQSSKKVWIEPTVINTRSASTTQAKLINAHEIVNGGVLFGPHS